MCEMLSGMEPKEPPTEKVPSEDDEVTLEEVAEVLNELVSSGQIPQELAEAIIEEITPTEDPEMVKTETTVVKKEEPEDKPKEETKEASTDEVVQNILGAIKAGKLKKTDVKKVLNNK